VPENSPVATRREARSVALTTPIHDSRVLSATALQRALRSRRRAVYRTAGRTRDAAHRVRFAQEVAGRTGIAHEMRVVPFTYGDIAHTVTVSRFWRWAVQSGIDVGFDILLTRLPRGSPTNVETVAAAFACARIDVTAVAVSAAHILNGPLTAPYCRYDGQHLQPYGLLLHSHCFLPRGLLPTCWRGASDHLMADDPGGAPGSATDEGRSPHRKIRPLLRISSPTGSLPEPYRPLEAGDFSRAHATQPDRK
jgi:hypothetical protein